MKIPQSPPLFEDLLAEFGKNPGEMIEKLTSKVKDTCYNKKYYHWDDLRHLKFTSDLTLREIWAGLRFRRIGNSREIPLQDKNGHTFQFCLPDPLQEDLAFISSNASGKIQTADLLTNKNTRNRYIVSSLIEEAIRSSQLEGAATTRKIAKEMIRSKRQPVDKSENMILNNYKTMQHIRTLKENKLTPKMVLNIHKMITQHTLDNSDEAGRLRTQGDGPVKVVQDNDGLILHTPPNPEELPERLKEMCKFANKVTPDFYIHPVIRAIALHFWLSYDHPFTDGNGRTARALFYWLLLREGYWLVEFISISRILKNAPAKYATSFLHTETDSNDLTYFLIYNANVFKRAIQDLFKYIEKKTKEIKVLEQKSRILLELNHRQKALISHALRTPDAVYTYASHKDSHDITFQTARTDLLNLEERGLLNKEKIGRAHHFFPVKSLSEKLSD